MPFPFELNGAPSLDENRRPAVSVMTIGPAYFRTFGAALYSGREFSEFDGGSGLPVALVNQRFANQYWPGENPLGKRLRLFKEATPEAWLTVVGVVSNIVQNAAGQREFDPLVYLPYKQRPEPNMWVIAKTRVSPASLGAALRREVQAVDSDLPLGQLWTLRDWLAWYSLDLGNIATLFLVFAGIALLLASVGLYAVIAYSVRQRTQEIGVRMAIGATARDIRQLVLRQGMLPVGLGLAIGLAASFGVNRLLKAELVSVSPTDPVTLVVASATLILAATLGCLIPARRATKVDPATALRCE